jgi:SnoaL-like domain
MSAHPFAEAFAAAWAEPTPERLVALLHRDVVLLQPHLPPIRGRESALAEFRRLFAWLPGLHGAVARSSGGDDGLFIEWEMRVPVAGGTISIPAVDRFLLADGLGIERIVYFDQLLLIRAVASRPGLWPGYVKYRCGG